MIRLSEEAIQSWARQSTGAPGPNGSQLENTEGKVLKRIEIITIKDTGVRKQNQLHVDNGENSLGDIIPDTTIPDPGNTVTLYNSLKLSKGQEETEEAAASRAWLMWATARSRSWTCQHIGKDQSQCRRSSFNLGWRGLHSAGVQCRWICALLEEEAILDFYNREEKSVPGFGAAGDLKW